MLPHYLAKHKCQLHTFTFILARIICFVVGGICFTSFYLFIYLFFLILTSI